MQHLCRLPKFAAALIISLTLCVPASLVIFYYTYTMEDISYDLSLFESRGEATIESSDSKGWTVYTVTNGKQKELTADGFGGYTGLDYAGQTFYYSRKLTEKLDSPTLELGVANRTIAVFLDDSPIYTDSPELDNRIGYLELPMLDYDRTKSVTVSLPLDYEGKTLTIAQSSPTDQESDTPDYKATVYPLEVKLYCGYAYESELISETARTMIPAVLLFALLLFLLGVFLWNASLGQILPGLPILAFTILIQICSVLVGASFAHEYLHEFPVDLGLLFFHLSIGMLLMFLAVQANGFRPLFFICSLFQAGSTAVFALTQAGYLTSYGDLYLFLLNLPQVTGFLCLLTALALSFILWRRHSRFFRCLSQGALALAIGYVLFLAVCAIQSPGYTLSVFSRIASEAAILLPTFTLKLVWGLLLLPTLYAAVLEVVEHEAERRAEAEVLTEKNELALKSYDNLRHQSEEMQMIRHDTMRHYTMLRRLAEEAPENLVIYLDDLIGQVSNVRPVVATGNRLLDIILNGELNTAARHGIEIEVVRSHAPVALPLTDTEACCLFTNILDNAITAASSSPTPFLRLDLHCRYQHFVFFLENSIGKETDKKKERPTPKHGYGLKIIRKVMKRWGDMVYIEQSETKYQMTVVIPLK